MTGYKALLVAIFLFATTTACGPKTKIAADWKAPDFKAAPFKKVVAIAITKDQLLSRIAEDEAVKRLPANTQGFTSYNMLPEESRGDTEKVKALLRENGIDGALVFRLVGVDTDLQYTPGTPHYTFYGYYGWAFSTTSTPDYLKMEKTVKIEAAAYSVEDEKLVWSALSESTDPKSARTLIDDVVRLSVKRLEAAGLVR